MATGTASRCVSCEAEINEIENENNDLRKKVKETRDKYIMLLAENLKKDHVLNELRRKIDTTNISNTKTVNFDKFEPLIGKDGAEILNAIGIEKKYDSSFVLAFIRIVYKNEIEILKKTTATGRDGTEKMSTDKKKTIIILFKERLKNFEDGKIRFEKLNLHLKNAFANSRREAKEKEKEEDKKKENEETNKPVETNE